MLEIRDYSLAEMAEVVKHETQERIYWEARFIFQEVLDAEGNKVPIYCRKENLFFEDNYQIVRSFKHDYQSIDTVQPMCHRPTTIALPYIKVKEHTPQDICKYYEKLGVKTELIESLKEQLQEAYSESEEKIVNRLKRMNCIIPLEHDEEWLNRPDLTLPALPGDR